MLFDELKDAVDDCCICEKGFTIIFYMEASTKLGERFFKVIMEERKNAKIAGNEAYSLTTKLFGNGNYEKMLENPEKYANILVLPSLLEMFKAVSNPLHKRLELFSDDFGLSHQQKLKSFTTKCQQ